MDLKKLCKAPGCEKYTTNYKKSLLCSMHRYRWLTYKSYEIPIKEKIEKPCRIEDCKFPKMKKSSLCSPHYYRYKHFKDYNLNPKFFMPEDCIMHCKIHGYLKHEKVITEKNKNKKCRDCDRQRRRDIRYKIKNINHLERFCSKCKNIKNIESFTPYDRKIRISYCADCRRKMSAQSYIKNKSHLKRKYGITPEKYNELLEIQNHVCAICKQPETSKNTAIDQTKKRFLGVDHDHELEKNGIKNHRGLLCLKCNHGLGAFKDNPEYLREAAKYIEYHKSLTK